MSPRLLNSWSDNQLKISRDSTVATKSRLDFSFFNYVFNYISNFKLSNSGNSLHRRWFAINFERKRSKSSNRLIFVPIEKSRTYIRRIENGVCDGRVELVSRVVVTRSTWLIVVDFSWSVVEVSRKNFHWSIDPPGRRKSEEFDIFLATITSERCRVFLNVPQTLLTPFVINRKCYGCEYR